jgi:hypothetical protein
MRKGFTKVFIKDKQVTGIKLDPMRETADIDESNNKWPNNITEPSKFHVYSSNRVINLHQQVQRTQCKIRLRRRKLFNTTPSP